MKQKPAAKRQPKDTQEAQSARFREAAKSAGASDDPKAFDKAFKTVVKKGKAP